MKKKITEPLKELRQIREKLSVQYWSNPESLKNDMEKVRKKFKIIVNSKKGVKKF